MTHNFHDLKEQKPNASIKLMVDNFVTSLSMMIKSVSIWMFIQLHVNCCWMFICVLYCLLHFFVAYLLYYPFCYCIVVWTFFYYLFCNVGRGTRNGDV